MLEVGDGIALASVAGIVIAAIIKFVKDEKKNEPSHACVTKEACDAHVQMFMTQLKMFEGQFKNIQRRLDDIDR